MKFKGKEYNEGEGSCMDCSCFDCNIRYGEEYRCTLPHGKIWIERKEKEEPKTKRMVVIWFGEVPVDKCENPVICDEMTGYLYDQVELIDFEEEYFIIDPPTPEPETVEDVLKDMPDITGYPDTPRGHQSFMENQNVGLWFKRLKAAQEVE